MTAAALPRRAPALPLAAGLAGLLALLGLVALGAVALRWLTGAASCGSLGVAGTAAGVALGPPGSGAVVGASEYGGPGDPSSGVVGASGSNLLEHPDSYAELGGTSFATATMMGGLAYMTPLRVTWGTRSAIAYKRDFGLGGGPVDGAPRVIDLWWRFAVALGIPYDDGLWSGRVRVVRPPASGAGGVLRQAPAAATAAATAVADAPPVAAAVPPAGPGACGPSGLTGAGVQLVAGQTARLLPDGQAAAPAAAPPAVKAIIAAGNQIAGKPYVYGAAHGLALSQVAPAYDCSSSVEHLLYGARLLPVTYGASSTELESFGAPGPGPWVTRYASPEHVFMYVAGLRWDTWNAAGQSDGSTGIGWHPLIRSAAGFVARHPVGL